MQRDRGDVPQGTPGGEVRGITPPRGWLNNAFLRLYRLLPCGRRRVSPRDRDGGLVYPLLPLAQRLRLRLRQVVRLGVRQVRSVALPDVPPALRQPLLVCLLNTHRVPPPAPLRLRPSQGASART